MKRKRTPEQTAWETVQWYQQYCRAAAAGRGLGSRGIDELYRDQEFFLKSMRQYLPTVSTNRTRKKVVWWLRSLLPFFGPEVFDKL